MSVLVAGYDTPLTSGSSCGGVGHPLPRILVTLDEPLGTRPLVDACDGTDHAVLDTDTLPALVLPPGFLSDTPA